MKRNAIYVRVSTDDQTDFSPYAQEKRCRELARLRGLSDVVVFIDEGWSGKNLKRPAVREMLAEVEADHVESVVVWRWDRLTRDTGDGSTLTKLFVDHGVKVYSVNEGELDLTSASGRMQIGVHGVFAQFYRDSLIENTKMGQRQAAESGHWINRAPTGYTMINKYLQPNDDAALVTRVFALRASGLGYQSIADDVGFTYSTVQHICHNRVYLGESRLRDEWFRGRHAPLVSVEQFNAAQRGHTPGVRRSKDLLSGKVRCGLCGRVAGVRYNDRNQAMYLCRHRGEGCRQPGRSALGLQRAARVGFTVLGADADLQAAIRLQLSQDPVGGPDRTRSRAASISAFRERQKRLLDLCVDGYIPGPQFAVENDELSRQIATLEQEGRQEEKDRSSQVEAALAFESVADLLALRDFGDLWDAATEVELRTLTNDLLDSVNFYPDAMTVQVVGAPPIRVEYDEVGLRSGSKPVVSEGRRTQSPTGGLANGLPMISTRLILVLLTPNPLTRVQVMTIGVGQKIHFGPMRFRVAAITSLVGIVLTIGAVKEFDDHNDASAWLLVIVVVECVLVTQNALRRYMQFTEDGFLTHGYQGGIVPRTRYRAFKDIQAIVVVPGPRASSNVLTIRVDMKNGTKRMIMAVSALRKSSPSDSAAARFEELVKRLRDSVEAAAA